MGIIFLLLLGMLFGCLSGLFRNIGWGTEMLVAMATGIVVALLCGLLLPPLFGQPSMAHDNSFTPISVALSLGGAILTMLLVHLLKGEKR